MGELTYLIIFLVVINIAGRIFRALQKSGGQQAPGSRPGTRPAPRPEAKGKSPFEVLAERLEELGKLEKESPATEEPPPHPYVSAESEAFAPEAPARETPSAFARETSVTRETEFESVSRAKLHEETFPWQDTGRYEYLPPTKPVTAAPGPEPEYTHSYRGDVMGMLQDPESVRNAVLLGTILGPCRAREGRYRFRGPR